MGSSINRLYTTQSLILALVNDFSPISTIKLQKLLFIAQYGLDLPSHLVFAPFLYGPYCSELSKEILPALQKEGFIQTIRYRKDQMSSTARKYSLTELGKELLQQWLSSNMKMNKIYRIFIYNYQRKSTEEIISESYRVFRKTIASRLLYFNHQALHERTNQLNSRISEKIQLKIPLESNIISDPVSEFVLEDFRESIPVFLSTCELYNTLNRDQLGLGTQVKVYGCFHKIKEDDSELIGIFSHHFFHKDVEFIKENGQYDLICKLTKDAELCYSKDFLGHICEMGGIVVEKNPLIIEPVYILGYYPRDYQS